MSNISFCAIVSKSSDIASKFSLLYATISVSDTNCVFTIIVSPSLSMSASSSTVVFSFNLDMDISLPNTFLIACLIAYSILAIAFAKPLLFFILFILFLPDSVSAFTITSSLTKSFTSVRNGYSRLTCASRSIP